MIENNLEHKLGIGQMSKETGISQIHLQRVFMLMFKIPLAKYIRLRKLSASLVKLAFSDYRVIDIAKDFGFEHEQSYIRAFKREFGITPGQYKKKGAIITSTPKLTMDDYIDIPEGILSKPDIVVIPEMFLIGDANIITAEETLEKSPRVAKEFWENNRLKIKKSLNPNVYIGLTRMLNEKHDKSLYLSSVQVPNHKIVPKGLSVDRLPPSKYLRFSYIGKHHPYDLNCGIMYEMYHNISKFLAENTKYTVEWMVYFEKIDEAMYDGTYCYLEWMTPISTKE